jgi:hypothetical protein
MEVSQKIPCIDIGRSLQVSQVRLIFEYVGVISRIETDKIRVLSITDPQLATFADIIIQIKNV